MAEKSQESSVFEWIKDDLEYTTEREKDAFKHIDKDIEEIIKHREPGFLEDAVSKGYLGSKTMGKDAEGNDALVDAGLDEVFNDQYQANKQHVRNLETKDKPERAMEGIEHLVFGILDSLKDHEDAKRKIRSYKNELKGGILKDPKKRKAALKQLIQGTLYVDMNPESEEGQKNNQEIEGLIAALEEGDIDTYTSISLAVTNKWAKQLPAAREQYLFMRSANAEDGHGYKYMRGKLHEELKKYDAHALTPDEYQKSNPMDLIQRLYGERAIENANKEKAKRAENRG